MSNDFSNTEISYDPTHNNLVDSLVITKGGDTFKTIYQLMIFAAMIARKKGMRRPLKSKTEGVLFKIFESNNMSAHIFLIALAEGNPLDINALKSDKVIDAFKIFEEYCNQGLHVIQAWIDARPTASNQETIMKEIYDQLHENIKENGTEQKSASQSLFENDI